MEIHTQIDPEEKTSVLIVSFNCWDDVDHCLESIRATRFPIHEIVVIDNASADGTPEKIKKKYPEVWLIQNKENTGHVCAINQGFGLVNGERILVLDADTVLSDDSLHQLSSFMDGHPDVWMAAPKIFNTDGTVQEGNRRFPRPVNGLFGRQSLLTRLFPNNPFSVRYLARDYADTSRPFRVESIGACCMYFRKRILDDIGEFDEEYFGYFVDTDWCKKIELAGGTIYSVPQSTIVHHDQNSNIRKKDPKRIIGFHTGAYRFYSKYYTLGRLDPRRLAATVLLSMRTLIKLFFNIFKKARHEDPLAKNNNIRQG